MILHSDAFWPFLVHWGLDKHLLKIQGGHINKKCSPEKVSIIRHLQIDTSYTQNLEFIHHELACSRSDQAKVVFWQMQKLKHSISKIKRCMLKVFNFLYIFQLIQKVLTSNFFNLVLNIHICLYKNSKILFLLAKNNFYVKISTFFFSQTPKSKAIFGIFVPSCPKSARNKVY